MKEMVIVFSLTGYLIVTFLVNYGAQTEDYIDNSVEIIAINDTSKLSGSSFLFAGRINERPTYWYYAKQDDFLKLESIDANLALINYTTGTPRIESYERKFVTEWLNYIFLSPSSYAKVIRIPEGSIVEKYDLDLQK